MSTEAAAIKPPYVSFVTLKNYLGNLKKGIIPTRIDKTSMPGLANVTCSYLISALKYFKLINDAGAPQPDLHALVEGEEKEHQAVWKRLFDAGYGTITHGLNLERASLGEVKERFAKLGLESDNTRKCYTFFVAMAEAAGVPLAPHLKPTRGGVTGVRRAKKPKSNGSPPSAPVVPLVGVSLGAPSAVKTMAEMLLEKFPVFDPAWPDDIKTKWFNGFSTLMQSAEGKKDAK